MKKHNLFLLAVVCLSVVMAGCCSFSRQMTARVGGAKAKQYGNVDDVLLQINTEFSLLKR